MKIYRLLHGFVIKYPVPSNISYMWNFGSLAGLCLVMQVVTGILLGMHYTPHVDFAFSSIEHVMRDVNGGWFLRYMHSNGASMFFIVVYMHLLRGIYYGSYLYPRGFLWCSGVAIVIIMIVTAFLGHVLPWGQMSFWGATVITNSFSAIPGVGGEVVNWVWGGFSIENATLNKFFSLHFVLPFVLIGIVLVHMVLLHERSSNNPLGVVFDVDEIPFHPYFSTKDLLGFVSFFFFFFFLIGYYPNMLGHTDNYIIANPLVTPSHIVPEWYFLVFYAILRSVPDKLGGVLTLVCSIIILFLFPFMCYKSTFFRSNLFKPSKGIFWILAVNGLILGWIGSNTVSPPYYNIGYCGMVAYFILFGMVGYATSRE